MPGENNKGQGGQGMQARTGAGGGGGRRAGSGRGPGGHCLCSSCGERIPHQQGMPCFEEKCPKCGKAMVRE